MNEPPKIMCIYNLCLLHTCTYMYMYALIRCKLTSKKKKIDASHEFETRLSPCEHVFVALCTRVCTRLCKRI